MHEDAVGPQEPGRQAEAAYPVDGLLAADERGTRAVRFGFDAPADTPDAVRAAMVALVRRTR